VESITQTVRPAAHHLFCKPDEAETITKSGFFISEAAAEKPKTAQVLNVGEGVKSFKNPDRIIYKPYSTTEIKLNGEDYFLISEEDVLGVLVEVK
jgi:chaperonin GroES